MTHLNTKKQKASSWFREIRDQICTKFEDIERAMDSDATFQRTPWQRENSDQPNESGSVLKGGGEISLMKGKVFEKVGVNISEVYGTFSPEFAKQIPGADESNGEFWASGVSLVAHMASPLVPAVHMNTRMIATSKCWFGGGMDLTPMFPDDKDTAEWHTKIKECCDRHPEIANYQEFKEWCDRYFFLPHRNEPRGIGGIFYDYLDNQDKWEETFAFTKDVGKTFLNAYAPLVERSMHKPWTEEQREHQLVKRGRYVEFNLLYDRGTMFGLKTGGNTEAILMSMPPEVKWP